MKKTEANEKTLQALDMRCKRLVESIMIPLKGQQESQVLVELNDSISRLAEHDCSITPLSNISHNFHSGLYTLDDELRRSTSGKLLPAINSNDDSFKIEDMNNRITLLLESFSVSCLNLSLPDFTNTIVIAGEPHRGHHHSTGCSELRV